MEQLLQPGCALLRQAMCLNTHKTHTPMHGPTHAHTPKTAGGQTQKGAATQTSGTTLMRPVTMLLKSVYQGGPLQGVITPHMSHGSGMQHQLLHAIAGTQVPFKSLIPCLSRIGTPLDTQL